MKDKGYNITRRDALKSAALAGLTAPLTLGALSSNEEVDNLILKENQKEGTSSWQLSYVKSEDYRSEMIEGYCSKTSLRSGEPIDIFISTNVASEVYIDIYRMGYYNGKGGSFKKKIGPLNTEHQSLPPVGKDRLRECKWNKTVSLTIPDDWVSGVYLGKLSSTSHRYQSYIIFVVRDDREADLLVQTSDTTWQAYNKWPDNYSLYDTDPPNRPVNGTTWISYDRPYGKYPQVVDQPLSQGSGEFLLWEYPLCYWLEKQGYDVTYCSNIDTHIDPEGLNRIKCFVSVGHDEYWSVEMYNNVQSAKENGLNLAFLCGNSIYSLVPLNQKNADGRPFRLLHRDGFFGGLGNDKVNATPYMANEPWTRHGPSERSLIGARTMVPFNGSGDWIIKNENHWIFDGLDIKNGERIPGLVGWEHHGDPLDMDQLEVIAEGETINDSNEKSHYTSTVYAGPRGNWVFNAATIFWSTGLSQPPGFVPPYSHFGRPHGVDHRVQRITSNFFSKCGIKTNVKY
ncbi:MAG: N,N-dimethylformamidase beta subunit family domain-containing protein [Bacteroidota bacterium]